MAGGAHSGWRRALASNQGTMVALVLILWLTVGGILQLLVQYESIREEVSQMEIAQLRDGFRTLDAMIALSNTIERAARSGALTPDARQAVQAGVDTLIIQSKAFNASNALEVAPYTDGVRAAFVDVISLGDRALAREGADIAQLRDEAQAAIGTAKRALLVYFDAIHGKEVAAALAQNQTLRTVTLSAVALLLVFCAIAFGTVVLFRAEVAARRREQVAEQRARFLAYYDPLTKLANRTLFNDTAQSRLAHDEPVLIALIDLDEFKAINDTLGHAAGDMVLRSVAERIGAVVGDVGGVAARLGGDEFAAILPHLGSRARVEALCQTLLQQVAEPVVIDGSVITPGASVGVSGLMPLEEGSAPSLSHLLHQADFALYASKRAGRGRYTLFDIEIRADYEARRLVQDALLPALAAEEFFCLFQPQVDLSSGRVFGMEALVRWQRDGTVLTPPRFLPIAEETGAILQIDDYVLRHATRAAARWNALAAQPLSVAVNLSALNFQSEAVVGRVADALAASGLSPQLLTLEMTETVLIEDWKKVSSILAQLHTLGVRISLDDFGTGYSSLGYLRKLEVDEVKIDRSFVQEIERSSETRFILDAVADIARGLDMQILVEGLESAEQVSIVQAFGCDAGQGFHFSPLLGQEDLERRLAAAGVIHVNQAGLRDANGRRPLTAVTQGEGGSG